MCLFCTLAFVVDEFRTLRTCLTLFNRFVPKRFLLSALLACQSFRIPIWQMWRTESNLANPMHTQDAFVSFGVVNFIGHAPWLDLTLFSIFTVNFPFLARNYLLLAFQDNVVPSRSLGTIFTHHSFSIIVRSTIRTFIASEIDITPERSLGRTS